MLYTHVHREAQQPIPCSIPLGCHTHRIDPQELVGSASANQERGWRGGAWRGAGGVGGYDGKTIRSHRAGARGARGRVGEAVLWMGR